MNPRIGFVSTYEPTNCGIATFTQSLMSAIDAFTCTPTRVVRLVDRSTEQRSAAPEVIASLKAGNPESIVRAANALNKMDIVVLQHEFGIYGGTDGDEILALLNKLRVSTILILHTVLSAPTEHQRSIVAQACARASAVVVMSKIAVERLLAAGDVDPRKIFLIQHGARPFISPLNTQRGNRPVILTWGLISPGKGVEWVIRAMDLLRDIYPSPLYLVAGRTHPKVIDSEGEAYREHLQSLIDELELQEYVELQPSFLRSDLLDGLIAASSLVVLPYENTEQVTSGVLIEAVSAGRPIIATPFPHAVELLENGAGILIPYRDCEAIAQAIRRVLLEPEVAEEMSYRTRILAGGIQWPVVARAYLQLASSLMYSKVSA